LGCWAKLQKFAKVTVQGISGLFLDN
jgi:hypothetical protein